ncbi:MAG: hypothetical protein QXN40_01370 [Candidatus Bathyarchaeia archaeon]
MDPSTGRVAFNIGVLLVFLALIPLPFLDFNSAEFIVDVIALTVSLAFLLYVSYDVRKQVKQADISKEDK